MHALSFSPGYLNYEADIEAPMATSISKPKPNPRESDESGEFLCGWGLFNGILFPQRRQVKQLAMLTLVPLQRKKIKDLFLKANKLTKK